MDRETVREVVISVLREIQEEGGYPDISISGATCPLDDLEGFSSDVWVPATTIIAIKLQRHIPYSKNIWAGKGGKKYTVDEIVSEIIAVVGASKGADVSA